VTTTPNTPKIQVANTPKISSSSTDGEGFATTEEMITGHMALVGHIVRETMGRLPGHINRDDLTSAGLTALVQAARSFDTDRGVTFARYASTRIRGAILDELRGIDWASRSVRRKARHLDETRSRLANELGRTPSDGEVATASGLSSVEIHANDGDVSRAVVMSLQGFGDTGIDDLLPSNGPGPEQMIMHREQLAYLVDAVAELPERLRTVVEGYFFAERPMAEIAEELSVSESRISQMRAEALALLKDAMNRALNPDLVAAPERPEGCVSRRREAYFAAVASRRSVGARLSMPAALDQTA
jgi:RNA polymerase sigma factor for flagellar operon FliA